ncbi:transmembrane protein 60-like [Sardina pilchardus]|uniref:transmembrane protein 60-like n=1 Tax=Sardina pilchardus TaxID=27697 RepID=UPI002E1236B8
MSLAQRVLITWVCVLAFLILLVLKLDGRVQWSWALVFCPVWTLDGALLLLLGARLAGRCGAGPERAAAGAGLKRQAWHATALMLQLAFCVALCARLHGLLERPLLLSYVCVPLWTLLIGALVELGHAIF